MASAIEWLNGGETCNPIRARLKRDILDIHIGKANRSLKAGKIGWHCIHISPGCVNCYAEKQNVQCGTNPTRAGTGLEYNVPALEQVEIFLDENTLLKPLHWKEPRLIFPCSMTDWMADFVPDEFRDKMLAVMALTPQHTYLSLTKRADRQCQYFDSTGKEGWSRVQAVHSHVDRMGGQLAPLTWPLKNLWLGISAENQKYADERIPLLQATPAAVRWVSAEPLLDEILIKRFGPRPFDWLVCGGESGPKARPMHPDWARSIRDQCKAAGVPFFFKQWGEWIPSECGKPSQLPNNHGIPDESIPPERIRWMLPDGRIAEVGEGAVGEYVPHGTLVLRVGKKAAGRLLDGIEHSAYPQLQASKAEAK